NHPGELQSYVASKNAGDKVNLLVWRDGKEIERSVTLKSMDTKVNAEPVSDKEEPSSKDKKKNSESLTYDNLGITVREMSDEEKEANKIDNGVMISNVKQMTRAWDQGIRSGLVITSVDKKKVSSVNDFDSVIKSKKGSAVLLRLTDPEGNSRLVGLSIPK
ncbi:MAG: PDZ domain-containing protein, partial [Syntrophothermus sp.]